MNLLKTIFGSDHVMHEDYSNLIIQFTNCRIVYKNKLLNEDLWIRKGLILDPERIFFEEKRQSDIQIDCQGLILAPGFIDAQINGGFGRDFTYDLDNIKENLIYVGKNLLSHGVTAYCPTIVSSEAYVYERLLPHIVKRNGSLETGASIIGAHLEGPFISKEKFGAHDVKCLKTFDSSIENLHKIYGRDLSMVKIVTLAPELDKNGEITKYLAKNNIIVSIGHSMATLEEGEHAMNAGATFITHLFNAMLPFHHRDPHIFGLLSNRNLMDSIFYGIIADGIHTHSAALNISYKTHPNGLVLVTDAISAMGLTEGEHTLGVKKIEIKSKNTAVIAGTNTLCGSIASMNECVKIFREAADCSVVEACQCASEHPAKLLDIYPQKGTLNYGSDADFIIIDENFQVYSTFINGDLVWFSDEWKPTFKVKRITKQ